MKIKTTFIYVLLILIGLTTFIAVNSYYNIIEEGACTRDTAAIVSNEIPLTCPNINGKSGWFDSTPSSNGRCFECNLPANPDQYRSVQNSCPGGLRSTGNWDGGQCIGTLVTNTGTKEFQAVNAPITGVYIGSNPQPIPQPIPQITPQITPQTTPQITPLGGGGGGTVFKTTSVNDTQSQ
jgi:hypothetical protein